MTAKERTTTRVVDQRQLSGTCYELKLERRGLQAEAGQLLTIHGEDHTQDRNYTIASGTKDKHLDILYRLIPEGKLTPVLVDLAEGDEVEMSGPHGEFVIRDKARPMVFVATGTGIAPCRSYVRTHKNLDITLLHGVRVYEDLLYQELFEGIKYVPCVSREEGTGFHGRVTDMLRTMELSPDTHFYLCGSNEMIFDVIVLLKELGFERSAMFTEAYYRGWVAEAAPAASMPAPPA